jgi:hypothetical protein
MPVSRDAKRTVQASRRAQYGAEDAGGYRALRRAATKHGQYSKQARAEREHYRKLLQHCREMLAGSLNLPKLRRHHKVDLNLGMVFVVLKVVLVYADALNFFFSIKPRPITPLPIKSRLEGSGVAVGSIANEPVGVLKNGSPC